MQVCVSEREEKKSSQEQMHVCVCVCPTLGFLHVWLWLSLSDELAQLIHLPKGHSSEMKARKAESGSESSVFRA